MSTHKNSVHLVGNLGKDAVVTQFETGKKKASVSLATTESYKNYKGEEISTTTWHNVVAWGELAEKLGDLKKGAKLEIKGAIANRSYKDKEGNTKYVHEISCNEILNEN